MEFQIDPKQIEHQSMEIITNILNSQNWPPIHKAIVHRIVHTSGDPDYANLLLMHPKAIEAGIEALQAGCKIITDVEMVQTGINKKALGKLGAEAKCFLNDYRVQEIARQTGETRSMTAMKLAKNELGGSIVAIGNAPTALFALLEICKNPETRPALIVGTPVGFVGAKESKEALVNEAPVPYITIKGTKGGSPIAASIINALLYSLVERGD